MACSQSLAGVAVEVLVEQHQVTPVRVGMEAFEVAVDRPPAVVVFQKQVGEPARCAVTAYPRPATAGPQQRARFAPENRGLTW